MSQSNIIELSEIKNPKMVETDEGAIIFQSRSQGGTNYFLCPNCFMPKNIHTILQPCHKGRALLFCHRCGGLFRASRAWMRNSQTNAPLFQYPRWILPANGPAKARYGKLAAHMDYLFNAIKANPSITLEGVADLLKTTRDLTISRATVSRALERAGVQKAPIKARHHHGDQ